MTNVTRFYQKQVITYVHLFKSWSNKTKAFLVKQGYKIFIKRKWKWTPISIYSRMKGKVWVSWLENFVLLSTVLAI